MRYIISIASIIAILVLILGQGSASYNVEARQSRVIAEWLHEEIQEVTGKEERSISEIELILRKLAHLVEYILLGTVVSISAFVLVPNRLLAILIILLLTLPIPFIDEFIIQASADGRSVQLLDVIIDMLGLLIAFAMGGLYKIGHYVNG